MGNFTLSLIQSISVVKEFTCRRKGYSFATYISCCSMTRPLYHLRVCQCAKVLLACARKMLALMAAAAVTSACSQSVDWRLHTRSCCQHGCCCWCWSQCQIIRIGRPQRTLHLQQHLLVCSCLPSPHPALLRHTAPLPFPPFPLLRSYLPFPRQTLPFLIPPYPTSQPPHQHQQQWVVNWLLLLLLLPSNSPLHLSHTHICEQSMDPTYHHPSHTHALNHQPYSMHIPIPMRAPHQYRLKRVDERLWGAFVVKKKLCYYERGQIGL